MDGVGEPGRSEGRGGEPKPQVRKLAGQGSNLQPPDPKSGVLPIELPAIGPIQGRTLRARSLLVRTHRACPLGWPFAMGSLIKKRRKRMRKKKHKKMLKATRWQRRAGK
jgi:hypothetical protein